MLFTSRRRALAAVTAVAISGLVLTACSSQRGQEESEAPSDVDTTFVFGASGDPSSLDPAFASDGESFRISRQIFEGLVGVEPGTADPAPLLAESWEQSEDGLSYTFQLKEGVTFHDGSAFNGDAVCFNFDRQNNFTGVAQSASMSYYWGALMRGYADTGTSIYAGCEATSDTEVVISLTQPFAGFIPALSLPAFAIQSPTALEEYNADEVGGTEEAPTQSEYATGHPTGTGPFKFDSWEPGAEATVSVYDDYWGEQGQVEKVIFKVIGDTTARRQALESGSIDGFDLVAPADLGALEDAGFNLVNRAPFNVLYLAFNQAAEGLDDIKVRQALTQAIDKDALISQVLPEGTVAATQFMPDSVIGWNPDVTTYDYDPEAAKALLAEAGYDESNPLEILFNYPVNISRPYMPNPEQIFANLQSQLEAVGVKITAESNEWGEYLDRMQGGSDHGIHLLGWTGDYNDPDNFVGVFFGAETNEWGFDNPELFSALTEARGLKTEEEQVPAYEAINEQIAQFIPGVPLAHPVPTLAFDARVTEYPASPVQDEVYNMIVLSE
ncbi:MAG: ABC transporter substrate-binding protein [Candidatus Microbacterium phytovorans]|uniref:ABC transporter substrate-binding protein n=1 Tax=Candidatus Microbacterium phytovorans TaxID=3121374 RepID=A0AAJ6B2U0_9MICO|nr:ABC transporter substrate-binding protein [Microbacterium sp.]WEK13533.1 MAG: ABC transporter substrate-binding protein [Microbacterium sp.]